MKNKGRIIQYMASGGRELLGWLGHCALILDKHASVLVFRTLPPRIL